MRLFSATVSLVALAAWLVASNHCAIAGSMPKRTADQPAHAHCHGSDEAPAEQEKEGECDGSKCCKSLSAPTLAFAKSILTLDGGVCTAAELPLAEPAFSSAQHDSPTAELDTGPPATTSFAESVLQRSLLAHAPPQVA